MRPVRNPKVGQRVLVWCSTDVHRPGTIKAVPDPNPQPGTYQWYTVTMEEDGTDRLTDKGEILIKLPDDDSPESLEKWLHGRRWNP